MLDFMLRYMPDIIVNYVCDINHISQFFNINETFCSSEVLGKIHIFHLKTELGLFNKNDIWYMPIS